MKCLSVNPNPLSPLGMRSARGLRVLSTMALAVAARAELATDEAEEDPAGPRLLSREEEAWKPKRVGRSRGNLEPH